MKSFLLVVVSAIMLVLSFAPFDYSFLAFFALVPLFIAVTDNIVKQSVLKGYVFGFVFFLGTIYWVVNSMHNYGGMDIFSSSFAMVCLVAYMALFPMIFILIISYLRLNEERVVLASFVVASLWLATEFLRAYLFTGFPWVLLGYSIAPYKELIQASDIGGVWLIGFVIAFVNYLIFRLLTKVNSADNALVIVIMIALPVAGLYYYGSNQINSFKESFSDSGKFSSIIVQGNIEQSMKWDDEYKEATVKKYRKLSYEAIKKHGVVDMVLWPETAVPFYLRESSHLQEVVTETAKTINSDIVTGAPHYERLDNGEVTYRNSAFLIGIDGYYHDRYDKMRLVPFGEYIPFRSVLKHLNKVVHGMGDFSSGEILRPIKHNKTPIAMAICFEAIYPDHSRRLVKDGAKIIANITNDGWFGESSAPYQHLAMTSFRAVENKTYLLRAANTGISAVINPIGEIIMSTELFVDDTLYSEVELKGDKNTFYTNYGDIFSYIFITFALGYMVFTIIDRRKKAIGGFLYDDRETTDS